MMTLKEICNPVPPEQVPAKKLEQCKDLLAKVNIIRAAWGKAMTTSSGIRTWTKHLEIYKDLAARKRKPFENGIFDETKVPKKSSHLDVVDDRAAVDVPDPGLKLTKWLKETPEGQAALEKADLFCEDGNADWVHFQNKPFASYKKGGTRWFKP